ncbi:MFS transporter [Desulfosediminicola flagellatus]|uniref:MFS transporter n=1 Tax=Desulfosediminicola flagellatus TaxID=2569541 RepID=UPI001C3DFE4C|nr:MFS transporter [Desulfosediminicola flagellatus]
MKNTGNMKMSATERSWVLYDVGNSAFVLIMVTAIMPIFFKDYAAAGIPAATSTANWGFANSAASLILAILAPVLGAMADYKKKKKLFFSGFMVLGLCFTLALLSVSEGQWLLCLVLFVLARVGWAGANVFYDAFITDVTTPERLDAVSARGYGWGYIGSVIPFLVVISLILLAGMSDGLPIGQVKIGFAVVAVWWLLFSIPLLKNVHQTHGIPVSETPVRDSFSRLFKTLTNIRKHKQVFLFLAAYFFYIDGVGTIISMSTAYGRDLGFGVTLLIVVLLFIQVVAFPFALLFGRLASRFSTKRMLLAGIGVYCLATLIGFLLPSISDIGLKTALFWLIAFLVASSMGGIQALSRSYYARLIPADKSAEFFGFYNVFGKFAAITGPFLMGVVGHLTGHTRWGVLSLLFLFIAGALLLLKVEDR